MSQTVDDNSTSHVPYSLLNYIIKSIIFIHQFNSYFTVFGVIFKFAIDKTTSTTPGNQVKANENKKKLNYTKPIEMACTLLLNIIFKYVIEGLGNNETDIEKKLTYSKYTLKRERRLLNLPLMVKVVKLF